MGEQGTVQSLNAICQLRIELSPEIILAAAKPGKQVRCDKQQTCADFGLVTVFVSSNCRHAAVIFKLDRNRIPLKFVYRFFTFWTPNRRSKSLN
jgi:hypothetical protein